MSEDFRGKEIGWDDEYDKGEEYVTLELEITISQ